ncbi:MAG: ABC transporter permease [Betaproteobacteria bacterium]|nr:ABC transporter permease [Betaproteobacteria bacterium]
MRQRHRTGIALLAVAFGVVALLIAGGFIEWLFWAMREDTIRSRLGHIQITRPAYHEAGFANPMAYLIADNPVGLKRVENAAGVVSVAPRMALSGLVSHGTQTVPFVAEGVDPDREARMKRLDFIAEGEDLAATDPAGVTLGRGLAEGLGVSVGDSVVLLANTRSGGINAVEARVRGVFSTSAKAFDDTALRMPIDLARRLQRISGAHVWVVLLDRTDDIELRVRELKTAVGGDGLEVIPWTQLADLYNKTVALFSRQVNAVKLIVASIIVLGISNTMMMGVIERTGEIGTAMALGRTRRQILAQFLGEGLLIGVLGGVVGLGVGWLLAALLSWVGIPMPPAPGMVRGYTAGIMVTPGLAFDALVLAALTSLIASFYPAWRASRLVIVDALRHNR